MSEQKVTREQRRKEQQKKKQPKQPIKLWIKRIFISVLILGVLGLIGGGSLFAYYASSAPKLDEESLKDPISSTILAGNDEVIAKIGAESRKYVDYEDIPQLMEDAILATEDVRFYDHMGVDFLRLGKAVLANISSGFGSQGASTLTQQVIKNSFLTNEKTLKRKAQEAYLSVQLEQKYEKEEIFEMYFNKVLMSGRIYGFGTAGEYFYGKELKDLELHQIAVLAGMPQSPNNYNPFKNPDLAEKRRNTVLHLMNLHGKITDAEMETAQAVPIEDSLLPEDQRVANQDSKYDAFLDVVLNELEENGDGDALSEGITVYTTLQPHAQEQVEATLNSDMFPTEDIQSAVAVIDTKTGAIAAVGGGRNYGAERGWNFAQDMTERSPGSTIKPLLDYAPAIELLGWSTAQTIVDEKITYSDSDQVVRNFDRRYAGTMTMREALYRSRNVPAVKTLQEVGINNAKEFMDRFGFNIGPVYESSALGAISDPLSPIELASAFAAFGNEGVHTEPYAINKIVYRDGKTEKNYKPESKVVMKDSTAFMITDILRDVLTIGTGKTAAVSGLDIAGKTGTSNYGADQIADWDLPDSAFPDVWFAGYTTNYSISVWSGYPDLEDPMTTDAERYLSQKIFKEVMGNISNESSTERFKKPNSVVEVTIEKGSNPLKLASKYTPNNLRATELFVAGTEPTAVSNYYEQLELNAPTNLTVDYDEDSSSAKLDWKFKKPKRLDGSVQFEVSVSINNGPSENRQTTNENGFVMPNIIPGSTYVFSVTAVAEGIRSDPASVSLTLDAGVEEPEIILPEDTNEKDVEEEPEIILPEDTNEKDVEEEPEIILPEDTNENENSENNDKDKDKDKNKDKEKENNGKNEEVETIPEELPIEIAPPNESTEPEEPIAPTDDSLTP